MCASFNHQVASETTNAGIQRLYGSGKRCESCSQPNQRWPLPYGVRMRQVTATTGQTNQKFANRFLRAIATITDKSQVKLTSFYSVQNMLVFANDVANCRVRAEVMLAVELQID